MSKDIQTIATDLVASFNTKEKSTGEHFYYVEDTEANEELKDFIRDQIHQDYLPDDFKYKTVYQFLEAVSLGNTDYDNAIDYVQPDYYYPDLLKWSSSNLNRAEYINEALTEFEIKEHEQLLRSAQWIEIEEICSQTYSFLEQQAEQLCEQQEEEEYE